MDKKEKEKIIVIGGYQPRMFNEGYQPKGEKIDLEKVKLPIFKSAALKPQTPVSEKKDD